MFKILEGLTKAAIGAALMPVDLVADVVTLGGAINEKDETYTGKGARKIMENLEEVTKPNNDD